VAERKPFLLRIDRHVLDAVQRWANDDLRSLNGQIEFLLRDALRRAGRARPRPDAPDAPDEPETPDVPGAPDSTDRTSEASALDAPDTTAR
jgi:hypothetical protein